MFANRAALKLLRAKAPEEVLGRPALDLVHPAYRDIVRERLRQERTTGQPAPLLEQKFVALDGTVLDVEVVGIPIALEGRWGGQIIVRDIRERKRAEQALRERDELLRAVSYRTAVGIALTDLKGRFVQANRTYQAMVGYTEDDLRALTFTQITHEDDVPGNLAQLEELLAGKRDFLTFEKRYRRKDGLLMWVRNTASLIPDPSGAPRFLLGIVQDISELKRAEAEAQRSRRRLETLSQRLLEAQEAERRLIARKLHDQIGQALTAVKLNLQSLQGAGGGAVSPLDESLEIVEQAMQIVRSLSLELRPSLLDDLGLAAALRWYADRQARRARFAVRLRTQLPAGRAVPARNRVLPGGAGSAHQRGAARGRHARRGRRPRAGGSLAADGA